MLLVGYIFSHNVIKSKYNRNTWTFFMIESILGPFCLNWAPWINLHQLFGTLTESLFTTSWHTGTDNPHAPSQQQLHYNQYSRALSPGKHCTMLSKNIWYTVCKVVIVQITKCMQKLAQVWMRFTACFMFLKGKHVNVHHLQQLAFVLQMASLKNLFTQISFQGS